MELTFGSLAFAGLVLAQFLAVIAVHRARLRDEGGLSALELHRKLCQPRQPRPRFDMTFGSDRFDNVEVHRSDSPPLSPIQADGKVQVTSGELDGASWQRLDGDAVWTTMGSRIGRLGCQGQLTSKPLNSSHPD
jgi:hypothetical protein